MARQPDKGIMSAEGRANVAAAQKRRWADPEKRAKATAALRRKNSQAILDALKEVPRRKYKLIAHDFQVSKSYIQQLARAEGLRRNFPRTNSPTSANQQQEGDANG